MSFVKILILEGSGALMHDVEMLLNRSLKAYWLANTDDTTVF